MKPACILTSMYSNLSNWEKFMSLNRRKNLRCTLAAHRLMVTPRKKEKRRRTHVREVSGLARAISGGRCGAGAEIGRPPAHFRGGPTGSWLAVLIKWPWSVLERTSSAAATDERSPHTKSCAIYFLTLIIIQQFLIEFDSFWEKSTDAITVSRVPKKVIQLIKNPSTMTREVAIQVIENPNSPKFLDAFFLLIPTR